MNRILYIIITLALLVVATACDRPVTPEGSLGADAPILPDYAGVTVPPNIAPLNFHIDCWEDASHAAVFTGAGESFTVHADGNGDIVIPPGKWREMLAKCTGGDISVAVCRSDDGKWLSYNKFDIHVATDTIDPVLVYRLIQPLYGTWRYMGVYQRDLQSYDQTPIYENAAHHGNCVNCHSFGARMPSRMQLHLRGDGGGTYILNDGELTRLDTKTDSTISNFTYPYWHPSGKYIAYSVNNIFQVFHTSDPNRVEVIDDASDVVVYDVASHRAFSTPLLTGADRLETFPAFSADGRKLYFCSAPMPEALPEKYRETRYSLCSIDFDPDKGTFGTRVDTLYNAAADSLGGSMSCPRPSPDGRWLVATKADYGQFLIWHKEADLWMCDLSDGTWRPMTEANSDDVESYHSWSGNSRWIVFSSRRDNGLFTRPYIAHIGADGTVGRPFALPQKHPEKYYTEQMNSFNIPELVSGHVDIGTIDIVGHVDDKPVKVSWK